jgi:hypothetical protein
MGKFVSSRQTKGKKEGSSRAKTKALPKLNACRENLT